MTDAELLQAYRTTRDRSLLEDLFSRHYPAVYHVVLRLVRNATDASDLTQSTFLKAAESAHTMEAADSLRTLLVTIAINEVRQSRRMAAQRNRPQTLYQIVQRYFSGGTRDTDRVRHEFEEELEEALLNFPGELRELVVLHYYQNQTYSQMAKELGIARSTVQVRMEQALQKLRRRFKKQELLTLLPAFGTNNRPSNALKGGISIMKAKSLATSLVVLSILFIAGSLTWRGRAAQRSPSDPATSRLSGRAPAPSDLASGPTASLPQTTGIFGRVIEARTGQPIPGALIRAYGFESSTTDQTTSDETGTFRLVSADRSPETYHLKITRPGYASLDVRSVIAGPTPSIFRLSSGGAITGRVVDADGACLRSYQISAVRRQYDDHLPFDMHATLYELALPREWVPEDAQTVIAPDGRFDIRYLNPGPYVLIVRMEDAFPFWCPSETYPSDNWKIDVSEGETREVRVVRPTVGAVRVRVTDQETHQPISGAQIALVAEVDRQKLPLDPTPRSTDLQGFATVPASLSSLGTVDSFKIRVTKTGYGPQFMSRAGEPNGFLCEVELAKPANIQGTVRSSAGTPVEKAAVYVERYSDGFVAALAFTDGQGFYAVDTLGAPDRYKVYLFDRRLRKACSASAIVLRAGETRVVDFGSSTGASLSGTVKVGGTPSARAGIVLEGPAPQDVEVYYTNDQGEYGIEGLAPGSYKLQAQVASASGLGTSVSRAIAFGPGERRREDFEIGGLFIRGTVYDSSTLESLPEGVQVVARALDGGHPGEEVSTATKKGGKFELILSRPAIYQLDADPATGEYYGSDGPTVDLRSGSSTQDVSVLFHRDRGDGRVSIQIADAATGQPIPEGWFQLKSRNSVSSGSFQDAAIEDTSACVGVHRYTVGGGEYVSAEVSIEITASQREATAKVALVRSDAVRVLDVLPSSPAERAGLRSGDVLVSYDGTPIPNIPALLANQNQVPTSTQVALEVRRGQETLTFIVPGRRLGIEVANATLH